MCRNNQGQGEDGLIGRFETRADTALAPSGLSNKMGRHDPDRESARRGSRDASWR